MIGTKDVEFDHSIKYVNSVKIPYDTQFKIAHKGTPLLCIEGGSAGRKIGILSEDVCFGNKLCAFETYILNSKYLYYFLQSPQFIGIFKSNTTGIIGGVSVNTIKSLFFALPPLSEQERIVDAIEKYEPLIAEYDKLETEATALDNTIKDKLKKSILQYAIQGKLVPQDENDEPASILLEKIRAERRAKLGKKFVDSYIYKGDDNCYYEKVGNQKPVLLENLPFEIPKSWCWARLFEVCDYIHRGKSPTYGNKQELPIVAQKCNQWDKIHSEKCLFAASETIIKYTQEQYLQVDDIIINSTGTGTVGRTGIVADYLFEKYLKFVADSHVTVVRANKAIYAKYVYMFLVSPIIQSNVEEHCSGSTNQIELATKTICNYLIPMPPINEQHRIVELFALTNNKLKGEV